LRKPAVFLDRDGVLNHLAHDTVRDSSGGPLSVEQFELIRLAPTFVRSLNDRGFLAIVVTNQPALAQGRLSPMGLARIHRRLQDELAASGARIDGIHFCPHDADADSPLGREYAIPCRCKKPAPGLILRAAQLHRVDLTRSFMICRDITDVKAGRSAALETILLTNSRMRDLEVSPELRPHHVATDLIGVLRLIDAARESTEVR
jgi:D-glycero-D-manno-heptose 1,7-bisphosphate phosphatase